MAKAAMFTFFNHHENIRVSVIVSRGHTDKCGICRLLSVWIPILTNPTLLRYCQYECKAIPNPSSQSSASQELSVLLGAMLICLKFHHQNACQFCTQKSLTAFSASENVSNSTPIFNSTPSLQRILTIPRPHLEYCVPAWSPHYV